MHYHVTLTRQKLSAVVELQGDPKEVGGTAVVSSLQLPSTPNTFEKTNAQTVYWIGPQRWLLRAALEMESDFKNLLDQHDLPDAVSAVLVSDSLSFFTITGDDADAVISIASPIDVHPTVFPDNGASYTEVFGLKAMVIRCDHGFELAIDRSYADMLLDYCQRAIGTSL